MYKDIISLENLLCAWKEFLMGKRGKKDVQEFSFNLMDNIVQLFSDLENKTYVHGPYHAFNISDPKPRNIHKAQVRDRLLHHAIYRILYPIFNKIFIADSYSSRLEKGTHKAMQRFTHFFKKVSKNNTKQCWVLKCDIKKFFATIDQEILLEILKKRFLDEDTIWLLKTIISSFYAWPSRGLPLGNLTSQLLVNIYMNEFDQWIKNELKITYYIRYADDFVILHPDKNYLEKTIPEITFFLRERLNLSLHPNKVSIRTFSSKVDFLGWVHAPYSKTLRSVTKRKMLRNMKLRKGKNETRQSYLGMLSHGNGYKLKKKIEEM